jgi:hypothetical protein
MEELRKSDFVGERILFNYYTENVVLLTARSNVEGAGNVV